METLIKDIRYGVRSLLARPVANLLLAQVTARQREFAVRSALGATRLREIAG